LTRRQPQQEPPLPNYGVRYFDHLCSAYQSLPADKIPAEYKVLLDRLICKRTQNASLNWHDLYAFDLVLIKLQPPESLPRIVWNLRYRYRDVAGLREHDAYVASKPPELAPGTEIAQLHADIEYLLGRIHLRYAMTPIRESVNTHLSRIVIWLAGLSLVFILLYEFFMRVLYSNSWHQYLPASMLAVVVVVGAVGGLISVQQRFQSASSEGDPVYNLSVFAQGRNDIFPSVISGGVFAAVLYLLIAAKLLSGELFPTMELSSPFQSKDEPAGYLIWFLKQAVPTTGSNYAKLLIWSFVAGFAERFVPDTVSRFIAKRETESGVQG
jgi:hypothetical protein